MSYLAVAFVTFEPSQLTVKSKEVFFIGGGFAPFFVRPKLMKEKGAVGKSADRFTPSVLLEQLFLILCGFHRRGS